MFTWAAGILARARQEFGRTFRSLQQPEYRTYSAGQLVSLTGTWMQNVALAWITYNMTHSAWLLGLVGLCTNLPVLTLSLFGGMIADRCDRRRVLIITQWLEMALAVILGTLVFTGNLQVWMILTLAAVQGVITAFEVPSRQAYVADLVQGQDMVNAISLNSVIFNTTRMLGPALGALLLAGLGASVCFFLNALSFVAALFTLSKLAHVERARKSEQNGKPSLTAGLRIALGTPAIRNVLLLTFFTSFFGFQFAFLVPVIVTDIFHGSPGALGVLTSSSALGALGGSLFLASRGKGPQLKRIMTLAAIGVAVTLLAFSASRNLFLSAGIEVLIGACISMQLNSSNSLLQMWAPDEFRGRVMSVYTMILLGAVPFGSLLIGHMADLFGAPLSIAVCGIACAVSALLYALRKN